MHCNGGIKELILLLVFGLGYIVLSLAKKEGGGFKKLGLVIGTFLVVLSGLLLVVNFLLKARFLYKGCPGYRIEQSSLIKEQDLPILELPIKK